MLDILRRQASSWLIKVILLLIIASFAFFFGYTEFQSQLVTQQNAVARVEDQSISRRKFQLLYENNLEQMRENFKEGLPDNIQGFIRSNLIEQLVSQEVFVLFAESVGLSVSDGAIAKTIRQNPNFRTNEVFDLEGYHQRFRPSYKRAYGESYEDSLRKDLTRQKLYQLADICFTPWQTTLSSTLEEKQKTKQVENKIQTASSGEILNNWVTAFREKTEIEIY